MFDFSVATAELAEAEKECLECVGTGNIPERAYPPSVAVTTHSKCGGTGRIVPFASLRVECPQCQGKSFHRMTEPPCQACEGRGWVPEPDVRVACWEIISNHPEILRYMMEHPDLYGEYEMKEAVIRAAQSYITQAWVEEQHGRSNSV